MNEAAALAEIRLALGTTPGLTLFRNNTGMLHDKHGRPVRFGLHPGSPDLVGWRTVIVTPDMVGQPIAIFAGVEVKAPGGRHPVTEDQQRFLEAIQRAGGLAGVARTPDDARRALGLLT